MSVLVDALERHGELVAGTACYSVAVRAELLAMSPATIVSTAPLTMFRR